MANREPGGTMRFLLFAILLQSSSAVASGCGGGAWETISNKDLERTEILFGHYANDVSSEVRVHSSGAYVTILNIGTQNEEIPFWTSVDLSRTDLADLLRQISLQPNSVLAFTNQSVQVNRTYDDCADIPENTTLTTTTYTLEVKLSHGGKQQFSGSVNRYDPPLEH